MLDGSFVVLAQTVQGFYIQALLIFAHVVSQDEVAVFCEILSVWPFLAVYFSLLEWLRFVSPSLRLTVLL